MHGREEGGGVAVCIVFVDVDLRVEAQERVYFESNVDEFAVELFVDPLACLALLEDALELLFGASNLSIALAESDEDIVGEFASGNTVPQLLLNLPYACTAPRENVVSLQRVECCLCVESV